MSIVEPLKTTPSPTPTMKLTSEQQAIINAKGHLRVNAIAGSGKTTTIVEYAAALPSHAKILYLAFNRSVRMEAKQKFEKRDLPNVAVETAHSLAHRHTMRSSGQEVVKGYKPQELIEMLELQEDTQVHGAAILANHVNKFASYYWNSTATSLSELDYKQTLNDPQAVGFATKYEDEIENKTQLFIDKMESGEIDLLHDFYLKRFQLSKPRLNYDYILFDEGQDASPAMLDIFLNQDATKVIVGDTHQQIYSWRWAINSLEKTDFKQFHLSNSFRFNKAIANLAIYTLGLKEMIGKAENLRITGLGTCEEINSKAMLARTNLGLLTNAIDYAVTHKKANKIYFEGNISSYTYAADGSSLYDVLNLHLGKKHLIKSIVIRRMKSLDELDEYAKTIEDAELSTMVGIVKKYGKEVPAILKKLRKMHVPDEEKDSADVIFSTVHRSKGMEYDVVKLAEDFITPEMIQYLIDEYGFESEKAINEEINLLYVAVTRAKYRVHIPSNILPEGFPSDQYIQAYAPTVNEDAQNLPEPPEALKLEIQKKYPNAYTKWTNEQDNILKHMLQQSSSIKEIAESLGRSTSSIRKRMGTLNIKHLE